MSVSEQLAVLLADIIQKKPTTSADAVATLYALEMKLAMWLVSELPVAEQKAVLVGRWAVKEVEAVRCRC